MFDEKELDLWIKNGLNVLFEGRHGVGKTAIITAAFDRHNLKWKYFSAATMDPWVDFVGIPKDTLDEQGKPVLDLVRPRGFHNGEVEAIFMDELNRAPKKVRNAVMELIQFKSINGVKFPNLKIIWAAINPEDDNADLKYDVDALDPAQKDRFHICIEIPYKPNPKYFKDTYAEAGEGAVEWWNSLTDAQKQNVSPRRLEYAIQVWKAGGSIRHVLNDNTLNVSKLISRLDAGSIAKVLKKMLKASDDERRETFNNINFVTNSFPIIVKDAKMVTEFVKYMPKDMLSDEITKGNHAASLIVDNAPEDLIGPIVESIIGSGSLKAKKLKSLSAKLGSSFTKYIPRDDVVPSGRPNANDYKELLSAYFRQTNLSSGGSGGQQRIQAVADVWNTVEKELPKDKEALILLLMFVSAVVARTQQATLNKHFHQITCMLNNIMNVWKNRAKGVTYLNEVWAEVKADLERPGPKKKLLQGRGAAKMFSPNEIQKIKGFLGL